MIAWHSADGWLAAPARVGAGWAVLLLAGGLAAPLFLLLAGASVGLALERSPASWSAIVRRGLGLMIFGWVLRLQIWLVDCGAAFDPRAWPVAIAGLGGCALAFSALRDRACTDRAPNPASGDRSPGDPPSRALRLVLAIVLLAFAAAGASMTAASHVLLRVDVLSCIGAAIALCACLSRVASPRALLAMAVVVALVTLPVSELVTGSRVPALTAWIARSSDGTGAGLAGFPLVPWLAYALLGCAVARRARRWSAATTIAIGALLAIVAFEGGLPWTRRAIHTMPWLRPLARLAWHAGVTGVAFGVAHALGRRIPHALLACGRASLAIYWAHLWIVFGVVSVPLHHALDRDAWLLALATLLAFTTLLALGLGHRRSPAEAFDGVLRARTSSRATVVSSPNSRA